MLGWSSTPATGTADTAEGTVAPAVPSRGRSALTRLLVDRIQDSRRDPFAVVMLELGGRLSGSGDPFGLLPAAARDSLLARVQARLAVPPTRGDFDDALCMLVLPGADTPAALDPLRFALGQCCQHTVLAERRLYSVRWRLAAAFYPRDGHAPCRLMHEVQSRLRNEPWQEGMAVRQAPARSGRQRPNRREFRLPTASDPLALV